MTEYDVADRVLSVAVHRFGCRDAACADGQDGEHATTPATGHVTVINGQDPATALSCPRCRSPFDLLGRMTRYEDGNGGWTTSVFDQFGKPTEVTDSLGTTTTFTYDRAKEPRGFVTSVPGLGRRHHLGRPTGPTAR